LGIGAFTVKGFEFEIFPSFMVKGKLFIINLNTDAGSIGNAHFASDIFMLSALDDIVKLVMIMPVNGVVDLGRRGGKVNVDRG